MAAGFKAFAVAALWALSLSLFCRPASADVIYQFTGTISGAAYGPNPVPFGGPELIVTDAAYASGGLIVSFGPGICPQQCTVSGNPGGLVSFGYGVPDFLGSPPTGWGVLDLNLVFNPDTTLSGTIFEAGSNSDFNLSGSEFSWAGSFSADNSMCGRCTLNGQWLDDPPAIPVPEPETFMLCAVAILGMLALVRWRSNRQFVAPNGPMANSGKECVPEPSV